MRRSVIALAVGCLVALSGCRSTGRAPSAVPPLTPPMIGSAGNWQPGYLTATPVRSSYSRVSLSAPARLAPVPAAAPMPAPASPVKVVRRALIEWPQPIAASTRVATAAAHAPDYSWLIGRLEQNAQSDRLYIRYGGARSDPHGGVLELIGVKASKALVPGQLVRVEGQRVAAGPNQAHPAYRPATIQQVTVVPGGEAAKVGQVR